MLISKFMVKQGMMVKSPPFGRSAKGFPKRWKERFFVLYKPDDAKTAILYYFESLQAFEKGRHEKGKIILAECVDLRIQSSRLFERDFIISLTTSSESKTHKGRVFHLCANNEQQQQQWYHAILGIMEKKDQASEISPENGINDSVSYLPARPTSLELKLAEIKKKRELERSPGTENIPSEGEAYFVERSETPHKRVSSSSGYASGMSQRDSHLSNSSRDSSRLSYEYGSNWSSTQDLFEFSGFKGPRISRTMNNRSLSMGNLFDSCSLENDDDTLTRRTASDGSERRNSDRFVSTRSGMGAFEENEEIESEQQNPHVSLAEAGRSFSDPKA